MGEHTFRKEERLCNKRLIGALFAGGSSFVLYPFRVSFLLENDFSDRLVQVMISVPKRRFKRAVDRNLLKRRMREAYRLHKYRGIYALLPKDKGCLLLSVHYIGKELLDYAVIERKMVWAMKRLNDEYNRVYMAQDH